MARFLISEWGDSVHLKLSFREAAALRALLSRVSEETDANISDTTLSTFDELSEAKETLGGLWPQEFEGFTEGTTALVPKETVKSIRNRDERKPCPRCKRAVRRDIYGRKEDHDWPAEKGSFFCGASGCIDGHALNGRADEGY